MTRRRAISAWGAKLEFLVRSCLTFTLLVFATLGFLAKSATCGFAETYRPTDTFLWGGQNLADINGPNADDIRATYAPIILAYPSLSACFDQPSGHSAATFKSSDLRVLPSLEAAEVCLFYVLSQLHSVDEMIQSMTLLGFGEFDKIHTGSGFHVNMYWPKAKGPIVADGNFEWLNRRLYAGFRLVFRWDNTLALTGVRLDRISRVQF